MGHTLTAMALPGADPVHKVSIIPRGVAALGYTIQRPTEERYLMTRAELEDRMMVLLGGRAAEELVFGHFSTGAADDLQKVTAIARAIVTRYGMHHELGHVVYEKERQNYLGQVEPSFSDRPYSEATAREVDLAVRDIVAGMYQRTLELLRARESLLRQSAAQLLERETLGESDLERIRAILASPVLPLPKAA
jgi:cell division protease FtsH